MNRKHLIVAVLFIIISLLAGCGGITNKQKNIYNKDKQIAEEGDTYSYLKRISSKDSIDINQIYLEFDRFYGTDTLWSIDSSENCKVEINYAAEVKKGEFKAVLITPEKEVLNIFEGSDEGTKTMELNEGKYTLKIVGKEAKGKIDVSIEENLNIELEKNE